MMPIQGSAGVSPAPGLRAVLLLAAVLLFAGCGPLFQFRTSSAIEQNRLGRALSANAATWAIPLPINPAPITPICCMSPSPLALAARFRAGDNAP